MKKKSKKQLVLEHLQSRKPITPMDALNLYGSFRLSVIIFELRKEFGDDYIITHDYHTSGGSVVAMYHLKGVPIPYTIQHHD